MLFGLFPQICYNKVGSGRQPPVTTWLNFSPQFITADKILISIHRTANTIWAIKIIRIAGAISYKQNCLRYKSLQRVRIISDTL